MRRVVSVWLPLLPIDRIRRHEPDLVGAPLVTVAQNGGARLVAAIGPAAAKVGLRIGMKLAEARVLAGALTERRADPKGEGMELRRLAEWCLDYAPLAAPDPPDGLWIDVTGSTHLHGGERRMLHDLVRKLAAQGFTARAAVADTPGLAHAMARFHHDPISVAPPGQAGLPDDHPVEALRLPPETSSELRRLGVRRVHQATAIARGPMARRFGPAVALRLDQAAGRVFEPIRPVLPEAAIQAEQRFLEPLLTTEGFSAAIGTLADQVCAALGRKGQGLRRCDLRFERVDGSIQAIRTGTARAVRDPAHLRRLLIDRLEKVDPGLGVETMVLTAIATDALPVKQATSLFDEPDTDLAPLFDRLVGRLGAARVYRLAPVAGHVPERTVRRVPVTQSVPGSWPQGEWSTKMPRPVRMLDPPQPVEAVSIAGKAPDEAPASFVWRRVRHRVRRASSLERIAAEWWQETPLSDRDYVQVEDEQGRRFWLFRAAEGGRWFLHGFF
ncbi:MAG TPA: DNA polymerase Y family protein [Rhodopila sp.]|uniref:Y-family DNA polymerase n=1 Tax=Rhodopila sp. TaxID=2480087 RepID=UPI002BC6B925|nr:DNA polymerase Y family protein [Rhodopila sp.]HVY17037.1 DNA polymerase Y family protein [Rhodopila sp.]